eukprot:406146-Pelagomonas_calceolata.AAC.1
MSHLQDGGGLGERLVGGPLGQMWARKEGPMPACPRCKLLPPIWHKLQTIMILKTQLKWAQLGV